jgi:hypothetical protein
MLFSTVFTGSVLTVLVSATVLLYILSGHFGPAIKRRNPHHASHRQRQRARAPDQRELKLFSLPKPGSLILKSRLYFNVLVHSITEYKTVLVPVQQYCTVL